MKMRGKRNAETRGNREVELREALDCFVFPLVVMYGLETSEGEPSASTMPTLFDAKGAVVDLDLGKGGIWSGVA